MALEGQIVGKYRILEPLGRGGMARVYRAYHPQLDRYVAIKVLRSDLVEDEEFLARFRREARAVATLRHPNVVQVFDSDVEGDIYYIVLELLEGDSLKTRLNDYRVRGGRMPLGEMVRVLLDVLDGLAYAHSEGMVHRDIKPANILLTRRGEAVITDFGIAQIVGGTRHTASGAMMGTLNYMAPEQGLKGKSDVRSDIYSLGIVCYEMLTQQVPFDADTPLAVLMKHLNDPLPLPRKIEPTIPEPLERVVLKSLAKQPGERYQSAEEMADALFKAAQQAGIEIPQRISLPLSFSTEEAPAESVAVFSGTARERITDQHFADDDTDAALGRKLRAQEAKGPESDRDLSLAGRELLGALGAAAHVALSKATEAVRDATTAVEKAGQGADDEEPPVAGQGEEDSEEGDTSPPTPDGGDDRVPPRPPRPKKPKGRETRKLARETRRIKRKPQKPGNLGLTIVGGLGIIVVGNTCMLSLATPLNWWDIYRYGWPIELFLVSLMLFGIMYVTSSIWLLIPGGITFGTGAIMAYCSLTRNWEAWNYLWLLETWVVVGSIGVPIWLARNEALARGISRLISLVGGLLSVAMILLVAIGVGVLGLITSLVALFGF